jgi:hypothetical protein
MTALPRRIFLLSHNAIDATLTFGIGTKRWEYYLNPSACDTALYFARRFGPSKALAYAKRHAQRTEQLA